MYHHPIPYDAGRVLAFSQLGRRLSEREETGATSRDLGLIPARTLQVGASVIAARDQRHVCFVHGPLRSTPPMPSARRAAPCRPETCE